MSLAGVGWKLDGDDDSSDPLAGAAVAHSGHCSRRLKPATAYEEPLRHILGPREKGLHP